MEDIPISVRNVTILGYRMRRILFVIRKLPSTSPIELAWMITHVKAWVFHFQLPICSHANRIPISNNNRTTQVQRSSICTIHLLLYSPRICVMRNAKMLKHFRAIFTASYIYFTRSTIWMGRKKCTQSARSSSCHRHHCMRCGTPRYASIRQTNVLVAFSWMQLIWGGSQVDNEFGRFCLGAVRLLWNRTKYTMAEPMENRYNRDLCQNSVRYKYRCETISHLRLLPKIRAKSTKQ